MAFFEWDAKAGGYYKTLNHPELRSFRSSCRRGMSMDPNPHGKVVKVEVLEDQGEGEGHLVPPTTPEAEVSSYRPAVTPFELPCVFNEIMKYLTLEDWKRCREVSSAWYEASFNCLKPFQLNIKDRARLRTAVSSKFCFLRYPLPFVFQDVVLAQDVSLSDAMLIKFLDKYGQYFKRLCIQTMWDVEELKILLYEKCQNVENLHIQGCIPNTLKRFYNPETDTELSLPKLTKLKLTIINAHHPDAPLVPGWITMGASVSVRNFIGDLLSVAPNLEVIECPTRRDLKQEPALATKLGSTYSQDPLAVEGSFCRVNQFLAQKLFSASHLSNPKITGLGLYLRLNARGMEKLAAKKYALQSIDLHIRAVDKDGMRELLKAIGDTLKHLRITVDNNIQFDFNCSFLTALESLALDEYSGDLKFIGDIPNLKSLTLYYFSSTLFLKKPCPKFTFTSLVLEEVSIVKPIQISHQARCIKRLSIVFPRIKRLKLETLSDKDLEKIYDCMPHLEELSSKICFVSSTALSGITAADTEYILDTGYEQDNYAVYESRRRLPYIGQLKSLKSLVLRGDLSCLTAPFAEGRLVCSLASLGILHGIATLKDLRTLVLQHARVSALELKFMVRNMNLQRLELIDCRVDPVALDWVKKKRRSIPLHFVCKSDMPL